MKMGKVTLVGAGPGDPELISVKGLRALKQADVILYDYLVHPNLVTGANPQAQRICVGKRRGFHSRKQSQIHQLMKRYALMGKNVVRLKGGDIFIFGRGGEECDYLKRHDIPFELVPGISSAVAATAYAGIPLTYRKLSRSVAFFTGSPAPKTIKDIPSADTVVCFMPMRHLSEIVAVAQQKVGPTMPAALIYRGTSSDQKVVSGHLENIENLATLAGLTAPALLIWGPVVEKMPNFDWLSRLPLMGKRVVLLRQVSQSQTLTTALTQLGADVLWMPLIETVPKNQQLKRLDSNLLSKNEIVIFTSANGVRFVMDRLLLMGQDARIFSGKTIISVGPKTAATLLSYGIRADLVPDTYEATAILATLPHSLHHTPILIATAKGANPLLSEHLKLRGAKVTVLGIYETRLPKIKPLAIPKPGDIILFSSSSTVQHFVNYIPMTLSDFSLVCIGEQTADTLRQFYRGPFVTASSATDSGMVAAVLKVLQS